MNMHAQVEPVHERGLLAPEGTNLVTLIDAPCSGSTWIAKIFDSHPDALYRHEPDTVLCTPALRGGLVYGLRAADALFSAEWKDTLKSPQPWTTWISPDLLEIKRDLQCISVQNAFKGKRT